MLFPTHHKTLLRCVLSQLSIQRTVSSYYQGFLPVLFRLEKFWCLLHNNLLLHSRHCNSVSIFVRFKRFPALTKLDQVLCHFPPYRHPEQTCLPHNVFFVDLFDNVFFSIEKKHFLLFMRRNVILHYLLTFHFGVGGFIVYTLVGMSLLNFFSFRYCNNDFRKD